jgi:hypothetical protein
MFRQGSEVAKGGWKSSAVVSEELLLIPKMQHVLTVNSEASYLRSNYLLDPIAQQQEDAVDDDDDERHRREVLLNRKLTERKVTLLMFVWTPLSVCLSSLLASSVYRRESISDCLHQQWYAKSF